MTSRRSLVALALLGLLAVQSASQAGTSGPILDYRGEVGPGTPGDPASFTIIINTKFWKIRDRIIIDIPPLLDRSVPVGGVAYVTPGSADMSQVTTFYGVDSDPLADPMHLTGFNPALFGPNAFSGEMFQAEDGLVYPGSPLGPKMLSELPGLFPGYDFSSFGGDPSSVVYAFQGSVPTASVPEPASLLGLGSAAALALLRRRRAA